MEMQTLMKIDFFNIKKLTLMRHHRYLLIMIMTSFLKKFPMKIRNKVISLLECSIQLNLKVYNKCMILEN